MPSAGPSKPLLAFSALVFGLAVAAAAPPKALADVTHVVQPGHTLETIAHHYGVTVRAIAEDAAGLRDIRRGFCGKCAHAYDLVPERISSSIQ